MPRLGSATGSASAVCRCHHGVCVHGTQMVSNGNEGYRAYGPYDTNAPLTYPFLNWMNSGLKGDRLAITR